MKPKMEAAALVLVMLPHAAHGLVATWPAALSTRPRALPRTLLVMPSRMPSTAPRPTRLGGAAPVAVIEATNALADYEALVHRVATSRVGPLARDVIGRGHHTQCTATHTALSSPQCAADLVHGV